MKILMFIGFAFEVCFFILTGAFLVLNNLLASIISFLLAIVIALFTGIQIKKETIEQCKRGEIK